MSIQYTESIPAPQVFPAEAASRGDFSRKSAEKAAVIASEWRDMRQGDPREAADWIDYGPVEGDLFQHFREQVDQFGDYYKTLAESDLVDEFYQLSARFLADRGLRHVFGDAHLEAKCRQWAKAQYEYWQQWQRDKQTALEREAAARLAFIKGKYGGDAGMAKGRLKIVANQKAEADERAVEAQRLRQAGLKIAEIAAEIACSIRTVYRLLKRVVSKVTHGKGGSEAARKKDQASDKELPLTACHPLPESTESEPDANEVERVLQEFADLGDRDFAEIGRKRGLRLE